MNFTAKINVIARQKARCEFSLAISEKSCRYSGKNVSTTKKVLNRKEKDSKMTMENIKGKQRKTMKKP